MIFTLSLTSVARCERDHTGGGGLEYKGNNIKSKHNKNKAKNLPFVVKFK